jgi:endo-1,4-beta-D-glucanase Y
MIGVALAACRGPDAPEALPLRPFPQVVGLAPGALRPSAGQGAADDAVRAAYDRWVDRWLVEDGDRARVRMHDDPDAETTSEAQGYGLVLVATLAGHDPHARRRADGLVRYALDHPSGLDGRLMDWHVPADGHAEPGEDDSAFDGDADLAWGLLLADAQWGSDGDLDYRGLALDVLAGQRASALGPTTSWPLLGDWVSPDGGRYSEWTPRSSDWMPWSFRGFADATGDGAWTRAEDAAYAAAAQVQADHAPRTGLLPDFLVADGDGGLRPAPPGFLEGPTDDDWSYNATRFPWRFGLAAAYGGDPRAREVLAPVQAWALDETGGEPEALASGYTLSGEPLPGYRWSSTVFQAPLMVAAMSGDDQAWLDATFSAVRDRREGYYEDSVTLLCLLAVSGRAWFP